VPPVMHGDPATLLRERNDAAGVVLDAQTSKPGWLGERLNVGYAIDVLHPVAEGSGTPITAIELGVPRLSPP
jgi:hypothetical protein